MGWHTMDGEDIFAWVNIDKTATNSFALYSEGNNCLKTLNIVV